MTKTRKQSKAAHAASSEQGDAPSSPVREGTRTLQITLPEDVDEDVLSDLLPDINFASPSTESIVSLYRLLLGQASDLDAAQRELDEARAESEKKEIELDQALQDRESLTKELEGSVEAVHEELNQVKKERDQLAEEKAALQAQVSALSNSQSSSSSEVDTLKHRIEDTEREKRDLVGVISRLKQESAQREEEIQTLRTNLKEARQEHQALEAQVREVRSTETSNKFKVESLTQQLQLAQAEAERTNAELTIKTEEFAKYRRTKHAEITNLQASLDSLTQTHASTQSSLKALQSSHTSQGHQLAQALARVQDLTGQLAEQEATYSSEANGLRRLVTMMEEREKQAKEIVEGIEREWAGVGEKAERRENSLRDEIEREKRGREAAEKRVEQLESVMDRMGRGELPIPGRSTPGTPMRTPGGPDFMMDGMMGLSPTIAMASRAQRSGKTFTEVYADYVRLQDEYNHKSAEYDNMERTLAAVLAQIEERAPILSQQRLEYDRLQSEASQLASQLAQALADRDAQANLAHESRQKLAKSTSENNLLQKQLEDLGRQVQALLRDIARRDDPTIPSDEDLENVPVAPAEDTESLITNNLVLFKSIGGLQEQNQKLLKIVRELGRKMESEERDYKEAMEREQGEAVREAHEAIQELAAQLERQKKSSEGVIQAYVKERDALRGMLARAEKASGGRLTNGDINGDLISSGASIALDNDLAKELAEVQNQFDAYRTEMGVDSGRLRDELISAQREIHTLEATLAKANAKIEYLSDRHRMHQDQFALHGREIDDLTKRNQQLYDQWTRIDIECSRVTEDLQVANGRVEQLRNECANLRAEKKIWESVQGRLVEENKTLAMERSHLSDLMANVQKMHNDLERSGENDRRRLESQLQMLEGQTQDLRSQVNQERDAVRHLSLQKEIELKEIQTRLDKNAQELSKTREALVSAETSKRHLEERVEDLTRQLKGNEEKLAVYERRPTSGGVAQGVDQDQTREQQLEAEVAELRSALKVAEVDLATARSHVQQFQEISQASEEALANLNSTYDEYKASTEAQIARHESEYKALQERLQVAQEEVTQLTAKYNDLQKTFESERITWANDKKTLEDTIVDMSTSEKHSESDRSSREQEVHQLEERAKAAEEKYSHEVIAHAESMKSIDGLKRDLSSAQATARDNLTAAETAQAKLAASEDSWRHQKEALDKEVSDLNARYQDLVSQNAILHQHLESVSTQAARIQQAADSSATAHAGEGESTDDTDTKLGELRSVVAYLRKEKEIVDLQLELSKQENARLKAQIDHLSQTLNETRTALSEERERAIEGAASASQHAELLERINQLNILRESNATLRTDCETHAKKARVLEVKLKQLSAELDPAQEQARIAKAELEASKGQIQRLEQESRRWQERNAQLLSKYDRIDPAEVQALKDEIERLKAEIAKYESTSVEAEAAHKAKIESLEATIGRHKDQAVKNHNIFKNKMAEKNLLESRNAELEAEVATLKAANTALEEKARTSTSSEDTAKQTSLIESLREERDKLLAEKNALLQAAESTGAPAPGDWEKEKVELIKAKDEALEKLKTLTEESQKATQDSKSVRATNEKLGARIRSMMDAKVKDAKRASEQLEAAVAEAVEKTKKELQATPASADQEEIMKKHAEEIRQLQEQMSKKHQEELKAAVDAAVANALQDKPGGISDADHKAAVEAAVAEHEKVLIAKHTEELTSAVERGRMESTSKLKVKDGQLVKAQARVKTLEAQILEWKTAGLIPENPSAATPTAATSTAATSTTPTTSTPAASAPAPAPAATLAASTSHVTATPALAKATAAATGGLPRKPTGATPTGPGVGRGGAAVRGARGGARGGAPARIPPTKPVAPTPATAPAAGGMSIMGAAGKRPREDGQPAEDSLAKRLKPEPSKPVPIRRPPPPS
ncbi:hypothetical protein BDQ12DRAFT_679995 [Crucibulum laeve]|uniref:Uncharacterized protein n=1 Tax=Crucibulum laeve TaxID=68775 RepID=A0A5C3M7E8_9AGAR|nr:hypothetical protein BDQ12DRAFT_679995 [Crucibulum laeve]